MAAELSAMLGALADDLENDIFAEEDNDFIVLAAAASIFARRNLNRILGYFEQTIATYIKLIFVCREQHVKLWSGRTRLREIYQLETHSEDMLSTQGSKFYFTFGVWRNRRAHDLLLIDLTLHLAVPQE